jgi:hypothetical protein
MVRARWLAHAQCGHLADTRAQAIHELVVDGGFTNVTHVVRGLACCVAALLRAVYRIAYP